MIVLFFALLFIPMYMRFQGSDELFYNKKFAFFLIWFSRFITYFLVYHIVEHFFSGFGLYAAPLFAAYSIHRFFKERSLASHKFRQKQKTSSLSNLDVSTSAETA